MMIGTTPPPSWLAVDGLLRQFGSFREEARRRYRAFVCERVGQDIWQGLRQQIYLGDEAFVTPRWFAMVPSLAGSKDHSVLRKTPEQRSDP